MSKKYFKQDEVVKYKLAVDPFYQTPLILKYSDPLHTVPTPYVEGVLYDSEENLLWHSIDRVTAIINDELLPKDFSIILEQNFVVGLKEKKGVSAIIRKVKELGEEGLSYKYTRSPDKLFVSDKLLHEVFSYYKGELPLKTPKRTTHLKSPSFESLKNTLSDTILNARTRSSSNKSTEAEKEEIFTQLKAFKKDAPEEYIKAVADEIMETIIKNDIIRNQYLVKRLDTLSESFVTSIVSQTAYQKKMYSLWEEAFNLAYLKLYCFAMTHHCEGIDELVLHVYRIHCSLMSLLMVERNDFLEK